MNSIIPFFPLLIVDQSLPLSYLSLFSILLRIAILYYTNLVSKFNFQIYTHKSGDPCTWKVYFIMWISTNHTFLIQKYNAMGWFVTWPLTMIQFITIVKSMVNKLNLLSKAHLYLYDMEWKNDVIFSFKECCLVPFTFGSMKRSNLV